MRPLDRLVLKKVFLILTFKVGGSVCLQAMQLVAFIYLFIFVLLSYICPKSFIIKIDYFCWSVESCFYWQNNSCSLHSMPTSLLTFQLLSFMLLLKDFNPFSQEIWNPSAVHICTCIEFAESLRLLSCKNTGPVRELLTCVGLM